MCEDILHRLGSPTTESMEAEPQPEPGATEVNTEDLIQRTPTLRTSEELTSPPTTERVVLAIETGAPNRASLQPPSASKTIPASDPLPVSVPTTAPASVSAPSLPQTATHNGGQVANDTKDRIRRIKPNASNPDDDFFGSFLHRRAESYVASVLQAVRTELKNSSLPTGRAGCVLLMIGSLVEQCVYWLNNEPCPLEGGEEEQPAITPSDLYRFLTVFLLSQATTLSMSKSATILKHLGHTTPSPDEQARLQSRLCTLSPLTTPTKSMKEAGDKEKTFEEVAYETSKQIFYVPLHQFISLDDTLFSSSTSCEAVVDTLFHIVLGARFSRADESKDAGVEALLYSLLQDSPAEVSRKGVIVTADQATHARADLITKCGFCSLLVMPEHISSTQTENKVHFPPTHTQNINNTEEANSESGSHNSANAFLSHGAVVITSVLKTLVVNAFIMWCMCEIDRRNQPERTFPGLDEYRIQLSSVECFSDFVLDACKDILVYTVNECEESAITTPSTNQQNPDKAETQKLVKLAANRKRNRIPFFNSSDGKRLRLMVCEHTPVVTTAAQWCALCGGMKKGWRGHKSSYQCRSCTVNLCIRVAESVDTNCWSVWHTAQVIKPRILMRPKGSVAGNGNSDAIDRETHEEDEKSPDDSCLMENECGSIVDKHVAC